MKQKPLKWLGFGKPLKLVRFESIDWIELGSDEVIVHVGADALTVPNEQVGDFTQQLHAAGIEGIYLKTRRPIDPDAPSGEGQTD